MRAWPHGLCLRAGLRFAGSSGGNALVEFALVLPVILLLFVGIFDFGMQVYARASLEGGARAGTQYLATNPGDVAGATAAVQAASTLPAANMTVNIAQNCQCSGGAVAACGTVCPTGEILYVFYVVNVSQPHNNILQFPGFPATVTLSSRAEVRVQ